MTALEKPKNGSGQSAERTYQIFISTGEVSGDLQGGLLVEALYRRAAARKIAIEVFALGGDRMAQAGAELLGNTSAIGSVGILESVPYVIPTLLLQRRARRVLQQRSPDVAVLIDYLGPNLGIGRYLQQQWSQVPLVYYIAPQEWVWSFGSRNTATIVQMTKRLLAIFPEEARYFAEQGADVTFVGHPLVDRVRSAPSRAAARASLGIGETETAIALFPASRRQEIQYLLPVMFEAAQQIQKRLPQARFWIPLSLETYRPAIEAAIKRYGLAATIVSGQSQAIAAAADLALTKSGTVNLELALLKIPQVVLYRVSPLTAWIAQHVLKFSIPFMSPPNLVAMRSIVPEFLQHEATPHNVAEAGLELLLNAERRAQMLADYDAMRAVLGSEGVCDRAAEEILSLLPNQKAIASE
ncbi:lipid-A-disaccharide synthase [Geitlerinema sp. PCC 7407]|uniref:lipid-A-disaccharide synthase n=1 Tax=Geitlerinema sp. PCC 7407 TaxID=1173025 RepID=UPI00029FA823|nr:lipid-A-disaccharide synthase [Geitlerinema sp. PCC 7407]AFY66888.1 lipid-A-disaccharide synthase [Geitlerinema sp. PCC 7407]